MCLVTNYYISKYGLVFIGETTYKCTPEYMFLRVFVCLLFFKGVSHNLRFQLWFVKCAMLLQYNLYTGFACPVLSHQAPKRSANCLVSDGQVKGGQIERETIEQGRRARCCCTGIAYIHIINFFLVMSSLVMEVEAAEATYIYIQQQPQRNMSKIFFLLRKIFNFELVSVEYNSFYRETKELQTLQDGVRPTTPGFCYNQT